MSSASNSIKAMCGSSNYFLMIDKIIAMNRHFHFGQVEKYLIIFKSSQIKYLVNRVNIVLGFPNIVSVNAYY